MAARCGTNGGYYAHRRRHEDACGPCCEAHTEAQAEANTARARALSRLMRLHPADFRRLYVEERGSA